MLIAITGISGSGKDTLGKFLSEYGINKLVSYTTRPIRDGEIDGEDYHFINKDKYSKLNKANSVNYAGNFYSFSAEDIEKLSTPDVRKYSVVNKDGLDYFKKFIENPKDNLIHVHIKVSIDESVWRMRERGDSEDAIQSRVDYYNSKEKDLAKELENSADYVLEGSLKAYKELAEKLSA